MDRIVFWISLAAFAVAVSLADPEEPSALCDTDSDCMHFCPPPSDDPDCDGGPERT